MRSALEISSMAAVHSSRSTLWAVSSRFAWSAATAASNSVWSMGKRGGAASSVWPPFSRARRYSSRAAAWSSGKPSNPRAWAKRTTVELEVLARRASSSAVWKAASSRWSTMYWPTSFCERENSSKRCRISAERVRAWVGVRDTADGFARRARVPSGRAAAAPSGGRAHALGGLVHARGDRHRAGGVDYPEDASQRRLLGHAERQALLAAAQPAGEVEQQADPGAVEVGRSAEVDHEPERVVRDGGREPVAERDRVRQVDLARHARDDDIPALVD